MCLLKSKSLRNHNISSKYEYVRAEKNNLPTKTELNYLRTCEYKLFHFNSKWFEQVRLL